MWCGVPAPVVLFLPHAQYAVRAPKDLDKACVKTWTRLKLTADSQAFEKNKIVNVGPLQSEQAIKSCQNGLNQNGLSGYGGPWPRPYKVL